MMETAGESHLRGVVEALLFISEKPVMLEQIKEVIGAVEAGDIREVIRHLKSEYEKRKSGMTIVEIAGGYQMLSNDNYADYIKRFYRTRHKERLSKPSLETLAIVAYKQPVSRLDIELIRGVNSDGVVNHLLEKGLIKIQGRKDVPGRPYIYATTKGFLEYFGLKSLSDLPKLEDFSSLQPGGGNEGRQTEQPFEDQGETQSGQQPEQQTEINPDDKELDNETQATSNPN